jgi:hypothetical protein
MISPSWIERLLPNQAEHFGTTLKKHPVASVFMFTARSTLRVNDDIVTHGVIDRGLCHTEPLLLPQLTACDDSVYGVSLDTSFKISLSSDFEDDDPVATIESECHMYKLSVCANRLLWHQRLCHCSDNYLHHAHKHIIGVPAFKHHDPVLNQCPTCLAAKLKKRAPGHASTMKVTSPYQGLSIDFAFAGQASKDKARATLYKAFNWGN